MALVVNGDLMAEDPNCMIDELNAQVSHRLRMAGDFVPLLWETVVEKRSVEEARRRDIEVSAEELQHAADIFRAATGLANAGDTLAWLSKNGISQSEFEESLEKELIVKKLRDTGH